MFVVFEYTEGWYNPHPCHSAIGYQSPIRYEQQYEQASPLKPEAVH